MTINIKRSVQILLLICIPEICFTQSDFAPLGAKWYYSLPDQSGNPFADVLINSSTGDTLINSKQFKVIQNKQDIYLLQQSNDSIKYLFEDQTYLAYDFGCEKDDTITIDFIASLPNPIEPTESFDSVIQVDVIIDSISFVMINSTELKRIFGRIIQDTCFPELVWPLEYIYTEKIGNEEFFLPKLSQPSVLTKSLQFRCYEDFLITYKSSFWESQAKPCDYVSTSSTGKIQAGFKIYPNPFTDWIVIESPMENKQPDITFQIYSIDGILLSQQKISGKSTSINTSTLQDGIYFLMLHSPSEWTTFKILKL